MPISAYIPTPIVLYDDVVLFASVEYVKDEIICISVDDRAKPIDYKDISVFVQDVQKTVTIIRRPGDYEECVVLKVALTKKEQLQDNLKVDILFKGKCYVVTAQRIDTIFTHQRSQFTCVTLFKNDVALLPSYIKYYAEELGVDSFLLYYNGNLTSIARQLLELEGGSQRFDKCNVCFVQWPFSYWKYLDATKSILPPPGVFAKLLPGGGADKKIWEYQKQHYAQPMCINHALYVLRHLTDYICFLDLDEYIYLGKTDDKPNCKTLQDLTSFLPSVDVFAFRCLWCNLVPTAATTSAATVTYDEFNEIFSGDTEKQKSTINTAKKCSDKLYTRSKSIVKPHDIVTMGIHSPMFAKKTLHGIHLDGYYHFRNFGEKDISQNILSEVIEIQDEFVYDFKLNAEHFEIVS